MECVSIVNKKRKINRFPPPIVETLEIGNGRKPKTATAMPAMVEYEGWRREECCKLNKKKEGSEKTINQRQKKANAIDAPPHHGAVDAQPAETPDASIDSPDQ